MNERLKEIRNYLNLSQEDFGEKIGIKSRAHISLLESGSRKLTNRTLADICREFNVSENWLRTGEGEMFVQPDVFSLDEYATKANLSELETDIIKAYINLDSDVRQDIMTSLSAIFNTHSEVAVAKDNDEDDIEKELESYRLELEAEKKARTSEVSDVTQGSVG